MKRIPPPTLISLGLIGGSIIVYLRLLSAGFVAFDDDIHVYANPFLNPPTLRGVAMLWQHAYEQLYVPLAYTILAAIASLARAPTHMDSSLGHLVSLDPFAFHAVALALHGANALLCYFLARRLTRSSTGALLCTLVFALHPLQVESVGWISELRGLSSSCFALLALHALTLSRQAIGNTPAGSRALLLVSALFVTCSMLCKPSAAALPLVALALDRIALKTPWRTAMMSASLWAACVLPFAWITHSVQVVAANGGSLWWQRPFVAGDALAFYLYKTVVPLGLCVDYGRTPGWVMSHAWGYVTWVAPVALLALGYWKRQRRPLTWLGALIFLAFLLPTSGLVPFAFQAYSTVADRFAYLALIGVGLMASDAIDAVKSRRLAVGASSAALAVLAALSFHQSRHWVDSSALLRNAIAVNPNAAFAYNNLGDIEQASGQYPAALANYRACVQRDPTRVKCFINLAEVHTALDQPVEAEAAIARVMGTSGLTAEDLSNLGIVLMKMRRPERALQVLTMATTMEPTSPTSFYNLANALVAVGQFDEAEVAFRRCLALAPSLSGAHMGLGIVLAETSRLAEALDEFRTAVHLQPDDPAALDNLKRAEMLMEREGR